ncbi:hypothetical protein FI667_g12740, partial [Globisporangium splendens]
MASAAPLPQAGAASAYGGSSSIASTVSSGASFDGMSGFSERGGANGANAQYGYAPSAGGGGGGVADVFAPMDDGYYTNSSRRNSFAAMNRVGVPATAPSAESSDARGGVGWMRTGRIIRVKDTGESFRFPLENDLLPRVTLTPEQYEVLKQRAIKLAEQSINSSHLWMENPTLSPQLKNQSWKVHLEKKNCVIYRQKDNDTKKTAASRNALVRAKLDCTLDELTYALTCDNTDDQRVLMAHLYQEGFLDAAVLHVAETATFEDPFQFLGVKWFAFQSSVDSMFSVRDSLIVEFCKTFRDPTGQKILARITQSINMNDYKGVERSFGFARSTSTRVDLFRSLGPGSGKVDASLSVAMQFGSKTTPSWFANRVVSALYNLVINLNTCADAKYIVKSRLITNKAWVPNNERPACSVCFKSFNLLRSRHHCRVCAEIMCTSCTMELSVLSSKLPPSMRPETGTNMIISSEKFCLKCINKCRQDRRNALLAMLENQDMYTAGTGGDGFEINHYGRQSDVYLLNERGSLGADSNFRPTTIAESTASFASSSSSGSATEKSAINYAGWSSKVLTAMNKDKPSEGSKDDLSIVSLSSQISGLRVQSQNSSSGNVSGGGGDRRRHNSDASVASSRSDISTLSEAEARWERRNKENMDTIVLLEEPLDDAVNVTPVPTTFVKMEESIAAQQALLRSMFVEGQKMMMMKNQAQQHYQPPPPPHNEFIPLNDRTRPLALPSSTTFEE